MSIRTFRLVLLLEVSGADVRFGVGQGNVALSDRKTAYDNLRIVRFAVDGRAVEFTEFWVDRRAATRS